MNGRLRIVVTGGAGFIGSNLCRALAQRASIGAVVAFDDLSTGLRSNLDEVPVDLVEATLLDRAALDRALVGADAVVHLGALGSVPRSVADPVASFGANAMGTLNVLEAARAAGVGQVIFASSSSVYGANRATPKSEQLATRPMSPYAASKLAAESLVLSYGHSYGLNVLAFRFFNVYGPLQQPDHVYAAVIPRFAAAALRGDTLQIHGDGRQSRDFTHVSTVVQTITLAIEQQRTHLEPVNLAFGKPLDLLTVVDLLSELLEQRLDVEFLPARVSDVRHSAADGSVLRSLFPEVEPVSFLDGLRDTVDWMRSHLAAEALLDVR